MCHKLYNVFKLLSLYYRLETGGSEAARLCQDKALSVGQHWA